MELSTKIDIFFDRFSNDLTGITIKIAITIALVLILTYAWKKCSLYIATKLANTKTTWDDAFLFSLIQPIYAAIYFYGLWIIIRHVFNFQVFPNSIVVVANILILGWITFRFIQYFENNLVRRSKQTKKQKKDQKFQLLYDQTAIIAIGKLLRLIVGIIVILFVMQSLGVSINAVLAFGGVGGIAIGFAAKDLLANFFGGLFIYLDRPFSVGDWIRSPDRDIEGTVEYIGWRQTQILNFDARPIYIPNAIFNNIVVENPSRMFNRRIYEVIGIRYQDFDKVEPIVEDVRKKIEASEGIDQSRIIMVYFDKFDNSSLNFFIYCFTKTTDWKTYHQVKHQLLIDIGKIIENHKAEIAFPTQTLYLQNPPTDGNKS